MSKEKISAEIALRKMQQYDDAVRFLIRQIEFIEIDGGHFDMEIADNYLRPLGIIVKEDYFQK